MKSILHIQLLFLISNGIYAQVERYSYHDDENKKIKEIYHVRDTFSNVLEGAYLSYYINGNIESRGLFSNNETVGEWEFYYETGKLRMVGNLKTGSNDGYWKYYFENGEKSMEGEISGKKRRGEWKIYYESGELKEQGNFEDNKREGSWTGYYEDGNKKSETHYAYGKGKITEYYAMGEKKAKGSKSGAKSVGHWQYYFKSGKLQAEGEYQNGKRTGPWVYYHENGQVAAKGDFLNGAAQGEWLYYHDNGQISSKGEFVRGKKSGYWGIFNDDGSLKGETEYKNGNGVYTEYYPDKSVKIRGTIAGGKNHGVWRYYYEDNKLEGVCDFVDGRGEYFGYYPDGTLQTKGIIDNGQKVGKWELYRDNGTLSGYYRPIYNEQKIIADEAPQPRVVREYGVGEYRFKRKKFNYFDAKINEFQGVIVQTNPFLSFLGRVPFGVEFYLQERLGHEVEFEGIRDPFYTPDEDVALDEVFDRGYSLAIKQKFYNPDNRYGLWYFGHEIRFTNISHYANVSPASPPEDIMRASASERKIEYSVILGYRLMQSTTNRGFTVDSFISLGTGYRDFSIDQGFDNVFEDLDQDTITLAFNFGLNIGYAFALGPRRRR